MKYLLDMDGVIVDFVGGASRLFGTDLTKHPDWGIEKALGITERQFWKKIDEAGEEFWEDLDEYPWTEELLLVLGEHSFIISTSPSLHPNSTAGKVRWLKKKFGYGFTNYMIGKHKYLMAKSGLTLIDDKDRNVEQFLYEGGSAVLFPQPWNANRDFADDPVRVVCNYVNNSFLVSR